MSYSFSQQVSQLISTSCCRLVLRHHHPQLLWLNNIICSFIRVEEWFTLCLDVWIGKETRMRVRLMTAKVMSRLKTFFVVDITLFLSQVVKTEKTVWIPERQEWKRETIKDARFIMILESLDCISRSLSGLPFESYWGKHVWTSLSMCDLTKECISRMSRVKQQRE